MQGSVAPLDGRNSPGKVRLGKWWSGRNAATAGCSKWPCTVLCLGSQGQGGPSLVPPEVTAKRDHGFVLSAVDDGQGPTLRWRHVAAVYWRWARRRTSRIHTSIFARMHAISRWIWTCKHA